EMLRLIICGKIRSKTLDACRGNLVVLDPRGANGERRERGPMVGGLGSLPRLEAELEPVPSTIRSLCFPQARKRFLRGCARLVQIPRRVGTRENYGVQHGLGSPRLDLAALV